MKKGIDISEHNGNIDFKKVKEGGIEFVIIRIGWIGNKQNHTLDKKFDEYLTGCINNNIPFGLYVYSYCTSENTVKEGANWLINQLTLRYKHDLLQYPIFLDLEDSTIKNCGKENLTNQAIEFCKLIENNGYKAGIYANKDWFTNYIDVNKLITYKIWLAEWNNKNHHTANFKVDLWQYTSNGEVSRNKY